MRRILARTDQHAWVDGELLAAINRKNSLYKVAKTQSCVNERWLEYKEYSKFTRRLMVSKRKAYVTQMLRENRNDPNNFWQEINKNLCFGRSTSNSGNVCVRSGTGELLNGMSAANTLNEHYATIGETLAAKISIPLGTISTIANNYIYPAIKQMTFRFVDIPEITSLVKSLKKPSGLPNIRTSILKDALKILIVEFTYLINVCMDNSYVPLEWKKGIITPIPKTVPSISPDDFRSISVLSAPSKVLERAVYNQLVYFLETNGLLDNRQHGFRKEFSTSSAEISQYLYDSVDKGNVTYCAFIDYSKAFDTLDHNILIKKIALLGDL